MKTAEEIYHRFVQYEWNNVSDSLKKSILEAMEEYRSQHQDLPTQHQELPSVEELRKEIVSIYQKGNASKGFLHHIAQHIIDKYSLPKREWWMDLKEGDKFSYKNKTMTFDSLDRKPKIFIKENGWVYADDCTPYVEPVMTAENVIKAHNLSDAEVRAIREATK